MPVLGPQWMVSIDGRPEVPCEFSQEGSANGWWWANVLVIEPAPQALHPGSATSYLATRTGYLVQCVVTGDPGTYEGDGTVPSHIAGRLVDGNRLTTIQATGAWSRPIRMRRPLLAGTECSICQRGHQDCEHFMCNGPVAG